MTKYALLAVLALAIAAPSFAVAEEMAPPAAASAEKDGKAMKQEKKEHKKAKKAKKHKKAKEEGAAEAPAGK